MSGRYVAICGIMLILAAKVPCLAQSSAELKQIMERLDRLESENESLRKEVRALREELHPTESPGLEERVAIQESRAAEQAQAKIESSQRFPIRLTGMALANAFINSKQNGGVDYPTIAYPGRSSATGGASWHQTVIGLVYHGSDVLWGGTVRGSLFMDFFGGTSLPNSQLARLRTAEIAIDWASRTLSIAQDSPVFSPRNPDSLAQVGVAPLAGSGNLWFWAPQARFEQRFTLGEEVTLRAQAAVVQTSEFLANVPMQFVPSIERYRPGGEGHIELAYASKADRRIEVGSGFHYSSSHVAGASVPCDVVSADWLVAPTRWVEFEGEAFTGQNLANFGLGAIRQGVTILAPGNVLPIHARGGWTQLTLKASDRIGFHVMGGIYDGRKRDIIFGDIANNSSYGGNIFYHLAPNVIMSFEAMQTRTRYGGVGTRLNNHYDLAMAYLF
jgi:hypothetical protein